MTSRWAGVAALGLGLALASTAAPRLAQACGGTFCDGGNQPMPVDQTGETILFVIDEDYVEAHIQIEYDPETDAEQFAWVVPVTALPEFFVGSQPLFDNLLQGTVPVYGFTNWNELCWDGDDGGDWDEGCDGNAGDEGGDKLDIGGDPGGPNEPEVVLRTSVGAFEVFVLDGGSVDGVMQWLGDNGFTQDPAAEPILGEYLTEGHLFVAFRLNTKADVSQIHPITLRYQGTEPCVPIRLTRIAAQDDMEIRALFLADERVASSNYRHVTLNPLKLDWMNSGANYREVVSMAVDEMGANGHAFVTEYAGSSEVVPREGLLDPRWDPTAFEQAMSHEQAVQLLLEQGLVDFDFSNGECRGMHPLVEGLVAQYLPTPRDVPLSWLCDDPDVFIGAVDPMAWDANGFATDFTERIVEPGQRADVLLDTWPMVTRLYTTISPHEMTEDPMFHPTPELPDVTGLTQVGTRNRFCDGNTSFALPDGRLVTMPQSSTWPDIAPEQMPWVETVEYLPARGAPVVEVDHRELIESLLTEWHTENGEPQSPNARSCHDHDHDTGTSGFSGGDPGADDEPSGCGCRSNGYGEGGFALMLLALIGLRPRRDD